MIEKLMPVSELADVPIIVANRHNDKINEIIDVVNMLLETHPKLEERVAMKKDFEKHMMSDTPKGAHRANND